MRRPRDLRLDVFRGFAMLIIFVAHVPENPWARWIPAAFGASDATEIFVFCSGLASALAFGSVFRDHGAVLGIMRTVKRLWQVYWAHIGMFVAVTTVILLLDQWHGGAFYSERLFVRPFIDDPATHLVGLMTLRYVPNYFDILPMYLVLVAMLPVVTLIGRAHRWLALFLVAGFWVMAQLGMLALPAEVRPDAAREWYFNPFGWQLCYFAGYFLGMGWLKAPSPKPWLTAVAVGVIGFNLVFATRFGWNTFGFVWDFRDATLWMFDKTDFGPMRVVHFAALAYLAVLLVGPDGRRLAAARRGSALLVEILCKVGSEALPVLLASMVAAPVFGAALDVTGRSMPAVAAANLLGCTFVIAVAYVSAAFRSEPWRRPPVVAVPADDPLARSRARAHGVRDAAL